MTTTKDPFTPPSANVVGSGDDNESYEPEMFSIQGRIGRLRYLAYTTLVNFLLGMVVALLIGMIAASSGGPEAEMDIGIVSGALVAIIYILMFAAMFIFAKRRFNDLNRSGWFSIGLLIPILNFFIALYLVFAPGTDGSNDFGLKPAPNPLWVKIVGLLLPAIFVLGILAVIAFPPT
jgi:uncharacterized membrane protein YhaH (DUF805 family)